MNIALPFKFRIGLLAALLIPLFTAEATRMRPMAIEELAAKSQVILQGKVLTTTVQRDPEGRIYTKIILQVDDVWKGNVTTNRFTIVKGGGVLGEEHSVISGDIEYEPGEEVVAFLVLNDRGEGVTLGLSQGKFHVWIDPATNNKVAHNVFHGLPPSSSEAAAAAPGKSATGQLTIAELKRRTRGGAK